MCPLSTMIYGESDIGFAQKMMDFIFLWVVLCFHRSVFQLILINWWINNDTPNVWVLG